MAKNTSITLGKHFEGSTAEQVSQGRCGSASEVVRTGLRPLEEHGQKVEALREALIEGERSGDAGPVYAQCVKHKGREKARAAGLDV